MFKSMLFAAAAALAVSATSLPASAQSADAPFVLHVDLVIVPADLPKYLELLKANAAATIQEPGCIAFNVAQNPTSPGHLVISEVYQNKAAMDAHSASDHFKKFMAATKDMVAHLIVQPLNPVEIHSKAH